MQPSFCCPPRVSDDYGALERVSLAAAANLVTQQTRRRTVQQFRNYPIANDNYDRLSIYNLGKLERAIEHQQIKVIAGIYCGGMR